MKELVLNSNDKVLILAPHEDDETIGCGGLLLMYSQNIDLCFLTNGDKGHDDRISDEECARIRETEAINAVGELGLRSIKFLNISDSHLSLKWNIFKKIKMDEYDYIFVPNKLESHIDHRAVNKFTKRAKRLGKTKAQIVEYEVWTPIECPNYYLNLSDIFSKKIELIRRYRSQNELYNYEDKVLGLGLFRGSENCTKYAEVYEIKDFRNTLKKLYKRFPPLISEKARVLLRDR